MTTMWRKWQRFNNAGLLGCIDQRGLPGHVRLSGVHERVIVVLEMVKAHYVDKSTPTKKQCRQRAHVSFPCPSDNGVSRSMRPGQTPSRYFLPS